MHLGVSVTLAHLCCHFELDDDVSLYLSGSWCMDFRNSSFIADLLQDSEFQRDLLYRIHTICNNPDTLKNLQLLLLILDILLM